MGFIVALAIVGGSGLIAYILGNKEGDEDQEIQQKYMMVEEKRIIQQNQSVLEFVNGDVNTSLVQNMHRRNLKSFLRMQDLAQKELRDVLRPFPEDPRKVNSQTLKRLVDQLLQFYKIHRKAFKEEILENRVVMLENKQIGQYILQKLQDIKDQVLIFQDVFDIVSEELQISPSVLYTMINDHLRKTTKDIESIEELVEDVKPERLLIPKKFTKTEAKKNMLYVLTEMKIIIEEYRELQIFVKEASAEDLQDVIDGLQFDLFYLYFGLVEEQQRRVIDVNDLNSDKAVQRKYEEFYEIMKFFKNIPDQSELRYQNNGGGDDFYKSPKNIK
eukprot:403340485